MVLSVPVRHLTPPSPPEVSTHCPAHHPPPMDKHRCLFPSASSLSGVTVLQPFPFFVQHPPFIPESWGHVQPAFFDPRLLPALGHLALAPAACTLTWSLGWPQHPRVAQRPLRAGRALSQVWGMDAGIPCSQGQSGRAAGDIEPSPAGGVHSSQTAAAGKTGPGGMETAEHLPQLRTRREPRPGIKYPEPERT